MPRYFKLRDGCDWLWFDVMQSEEAIEAFARSIESADDVKIERDKIKVFRFHESHRLAGQVSRLQYNEGRHYWVASRES